VPDGNAKKDSSAAKGDLAKALARLHAETAERRRLEERLRLVPNQILQAEDAERRRIARELHDGVNQLLGSIKFRLLHLESLLPEHAQPVGELAKLLERAVNEVRRISQNLRPTELEDFGLIAAVEGLIRDFQTRTKVRVDFQRPAAPRLPSDVELTLYRVLQEALVNVEKHARASSVTVLLFTDANFATLNVRDDGNGFVEGANPRGIGLINMRERAHALGGLFSIKSELGRGTELSVHLKLGK
jgi:two-component system NarL family sensor kinase